MLEISALGPRGDAGPSFQDPGMHHRGPGSTRVSDCFGDKADHLLGLRQCRENCGDPPTEDPSSARLLAACAGKMLFDSNHTPRGHRPRGMRPRVGNEEERGLLAQGLCLQSVHPREAGVAFPGVQRVTSNMVARFPAAHGRAGWAVSRARLRAEGRSVSEDPH